VFTLAGAEDHRLLWRPSLIVTSRHHYMKENQERVFGNRAFCRGRSGPARARCVGVPDGAGRMSFASCCVGRPSLQVVQPSHCRAAVILKADQRAHPPAAVRVGPWEQRNSKAQNTPDPIVNRDRRVPDAPQAADKLPSKSAAMREGRRCHCLQNSVAGGPAPWFFWTVFSRWARGEGHCVRWPPVSLVGPGLPGFWGRLRPPLPAPVPAAMSSSWLISSPRLTRPWQWRGVPRGRRQVPLRPGGS